MTEYEGAKAEQELPCTVYRVSPEGGIEAVIATCRGRTARFQPDGSRLYVADTGACSLPIRSISACSTWSMADREWAYLPCDQAGCADGMRVDTDGNLWSSQRMASIASRRMASDGQDPVPEMVSNLCFGGHSSTGCSSRRPRASIRWCSTGAASRPLEASLVPYTVSPGTRRVGTKVTGWTVRPSAWRQGLRPPPCRCWSSARRSWSGASAGWKPPPSRPIRRCRCPRARSSRGTDRRQVPPIAISSLWK